MNSFTIVIDTSCDLSDEYIKENDIDVLPIPFYLGDMEYSEGYWQEISGKEFYDKLRKGSISRTSQINFDTYYKTFSDYARQGREAVFIILSSGLSATYENAMAALEEVREKYPDCKLYPIDSISATSLNTLLVILAVKKRSEGMSALETAAWLEHKKNNVLGFFTVDDLMYLHRGGRLSKLSAVGGSVLGIKPILNISPTGTLAVKDKIRGREAALKYMVNQVKISISPDTVLDTVVITHTDCEEDANKLAEMVKAEIQVKNILILIMGPVIGAHVGPGAVTIVFEADITREDYDNKRYKRN